ncbi:DNA repair protein [Shewanella sp. KX20019]|uniref:DNA repair protein n=1 Tax=Shewanella sp. KX20019 TaxID=2803864 RepID=UPI0019283DD3|nr:DNA repair protein [Shewanella sp. KX20019]QQX81373.1 DNA repair protein [Shewanella sp. KX20019]
MGLFSWAASKCRSIKNAVSNVIDKVKETVSKVWNAFTGKYYTDEAEAIYDEINEKYKKSKIEYEDAVKIMGDSIESKISHLNNFKTDIYQKHFNRFIKIASRLHNVTVQGVPFTELFDDSILEIKNETGVSHKQDLFLIDFNKMGFLDTAGMILTLGFFSRKKAKESLEKVKQEQIRVNAEIETMRSQQTKLAVIAESIDNVVEYFEQLITHYESLLERFEFGIQTQRFKKMSQADNVFELKLNFKHMPIVHIEEFQALFNLSIVLKQMATLGYLNAAGELIEDDKKAAVSLFEQAVASKACA